MKGIVASMPLGFLIGILLVGLVSTRIVQSNFIRTSTDNKLRIIPFVTGLITGSVSLYPATYYCIVVGGTLGGGFAEYLSIKLGFGSKGVPFGITAGIGLVFSGIILLSVVTGMVTGKAIEKFRNIYNQ